MVKPLTFKGDKPKKRKHREYDDADDRVKLTRTVAARDASHGASNIESNADETADDQSWVSADIPTDIAGPVIFVLPSEPPTCIACDATGNVFSSPLENLIEGNPATAEPHDVRQVWVATKVAGTEGFSFKGHHGKYLSCDQHGILSATTSAISHYESFLVIPAPEVQGMFSLQTGGGDTESFISVKECPSKKVASGMVVEIRGDATTISFETTIRIRMQARFKPKIRLSKEIKSKEKASRKELENAVGRKLEEHEMKRLRRARREGNFHEEVLDMRVKGKHDKFA